MIGQYLSNTNEIGTIHILQNIFGTKQGPKLLEFGCFGLQRKGVTYGLV